MGTIRIAAMCVSVVALSAASLWAGQSGEFSAKPKDLVSDKFQGVYRSGRALQLRTRIGANKGGFAALLRRFSQDVESLTGTAVSGRDKEILEKYQSARATYVHMVDCCWTTNDQSPELVARFQAMLAASSHAMENAHRAARGLTELPPAELRN